MLKLRVHGQTFFKSENSSTKLKLTIIINDYFASTYRGINIGANLAYLNWTFSPQFKEEQDWLGPTLTSFPRWTIISFRGYIFRCKIKLTQPRLNPNPNSDHSKRKALISWITMIGQTHGQERDTCAVRCRLNRLTHRC